MRLCYYFYDLILLPFSNPFSMLLGRCVFYCFCLIICGYEVSMHFYYLSFYCPFLLSTKFLLHWCYPIFTTQNYYPCHCLLLIFIIHFIDPILLPNSILPALLSPSFCYLSISVSTIHWLTIFLTMYFVTHSFYYRLYYPPFITHLLLPILLPHYSSPLALLSAINFLYHPVYSPPPVSGHVRHFVRILSMGDLKLRVCRGKHCGCRPLLSGINEVALCRLRER